MGFFKKAFSPFKAVYKAAEAVGDPIVAAVLGGDMKMPPKPERPATVPKREQRVGEDDITVGDATKTRGATPVAGSRTTRTGNFLNLMQSVVDDRIGLGV